MRLSTFLGVCLGLACWLLAGILWKLDSESHRFTVRTLPVKARVANAYWAGYVSTGQYPFSGVRASWRVPAISCGSAGHEPVTYMWIGEGGYLRGLASPLIQAGTGAECTTGVPRYHIFYEWYPGISASDFPMSVQPGDRVSMQITQTQPDYWMLSAHDLTTGARSATATYFHADTGSADFIVERPTVCGPDGCWQYPLANFGAVSFDDLTISEAGGMVASIPHALSIALVDPGSRRILAVPARRDGSKNSVSVLWRESG